MNELNIQIRESRKADLEDIMYVQSRAFGHDKEAQLTADLLQDNTAEPLLSLLAFDQQKVIGHILFTRVYINKVDKTQPLMHILAPLAVIPDYQNRGIGGVLIREGLNRLKRMGSELVFVLGHMEYYPKLGFIPDAKKIGYSAPFPIPDEFANAWMVQSLNPNRFTIEKGQVICAKTLNRPEHWRE